MPEEGAGLSAVARRRLRQDGAPTQAPARPPSTQKKRRLVKHPRNAEADDDGPTPKRTHQPTTSSSVESAAHEVDHDGDSPFANSFASLTDRGQYTAEVGKIEQLANKRVRVLVAKGKKIFVIGMCSLWVKTGVVTVYGAVLAASEAVYHFFAPFIYSIPAITALSEVSEVELSCLDEGLEGLAKLQGLSLWDPPAGTVQAESSFFLLGHHFNRDPSLIAQQELDITQWHQPLSDISNPYENAQSLSPRTLVVGRRSSGQSTFVRCLINRLLTAWGSSARPTNREVMLLDFDFDMPEITPFGMMAVSRIKEPLLGPSFTHPANPSDVIKMHFVGGLGKRTSISQLADQIQDLVQTARIHLTESVPVVIRLPAWLASTMGDTLEHIWDSLGITALVQTDNSPLDVLEVLVGHYGASHVRLEPKSFDTRIGASDDREIRTWTYFHAAPSSPGRRYWTDTALAATSHTRKTLDFGSSKGMFAALVLLDRLVALEDTCEAIAGGIGALVSVSKIYFDSSIRPHVQHEPDGLPRLKSSWQFALPPSQSCCMGLAYVAEVQTETLEVIVYTPVPADQMRAREDRIYLFVLPGRRNGWLSSAFIADELEAVGQG